MVLSAPPGESEGEPDAPTTGWSPVMADATIIPPATSAIAPINAQSGRGGLRAWRPLTRRAPRRGRALVRSTSSAIAATSSSTVS